MGGREKRGKGSRMCVDGIEREIIIKITVLTGVKSTQLSVTIILLVSPFHFGLTVFKFIARPEPSIKGYSRLSVVSHFTSGLVMGSIPPLLGHLADIRVNSQYGAVFALSDTGTNLGYFLGRPRSTHSLLTSLLVV